MDDMQKELIVQMIDDAIALAENGMFDDAIDTIRKIKEKLENEY